MRVALVSAPYDVKLFRVGENLGIKYLAATLEQEGVEVDVIEPSLTNLDKDGLISRLLDDDYQLIGFSVMFDRAFPNVLAIVQKLRALGSQAHITIGGHFPSFGYREILEQESGIDSVVRFEGELTLLELVQKLDTTDQWHSIRGLAFKRGGQIVSNPLRDLILDLDILPYPRRDSASRHLGDPHFFMITTRGCPFACTFCSVPAFYRTPKGNPWRARSVRNVVDELEYLVQEWDAKAISFLDDEFLASRLGKKRAIELASQFLEHQLDIAWSLECRADDVDKELFSLLKDAGLRHVFIGIESGVQRVLDTFKKGTTVQQNRQAIEMVRNLNLSLAVGFIMYDPYITLDELRANVDFLEEVNYHHQRWWLLGSPLKRSPVN